MKSIYKFTIAIIAILTLQNCVNKIVVNREVDTKEYGKMLLGAQTLSQFQKEPYKTWYDQNYKEYPLDKTTIEQLKKEKLSSYKIKVFLGTWCGDSKREFPRLIKILNEINYPDSKLEIVGVNRKKEAPNGDEVKYNIKKVPTIILEKYGKEVGRIIESPTSGYLEKDLLEIIKK